MQEFEYTTRKWRIVENLSYVVKGGYGHSAAYDKLMENIYVYGGITSESADQQTGIPHLYAYSPSTHTWTLLSSAPSVRLLHTFNFLNEALMTVVAGTGLNVR